MYHLESRAVILVDRSAQKTQTWWRTLYVDTSLILGMYDFCSKKLWFSKFSVWLRNFNEAKLKCSKALHCLFFAYKLLV